MSEHWTLHEGDCLAILPTLPAASVDAIVTDPPYHLHRSASGASGFMGKGWDGGDIAFRPDVWHEALRVAKPGAHLVAAGSTRTYHRLVCAIEDAGWIVEDTICWHYGNGFPKSLNVSQHIDRIAVVGGAYRQEDHPGRPGSRIRHERPEKLGQANSVNGDNPDGLRQIYEPATDDAKRWNGWGTALKPATELWCLARAPFRGTVAANVLAHGTGALNIDACRIDAGGPRELRFGAARTTTPGWGTIQGGSVGGGMTDQGRWPANVVLDEAAAAALDSSTGPLRSGMMRAGTVRANTSGFHGAMPDSVLRGTYGDTGGPSRFFYTAKADTADRAGSKHPTVKPLALLSYLVRLVMPPGGVVLDMFAGSGTTGQAVLMEGGSAILIEREPEYCDDIRRRMRNVPVSLWAGAGCDE